MALTERTFFREFLFVKSAPDAAPAAHMVPITEVLRDGVVISAQYGDAQALTVEEAGQLVSAELVNALNERDQAASQRDQALAVLATAQAEIARLTNLLNQGE